MFDVNIRKLGDSGILGTRQFVFGQVITRFSTQGEDISWDKFLLNNPKGRYEQSSLAARCTQER